jgi:hypothetical protein
MTFAEFWLRLRAAWRVLRHGEQIPFYVVPCLFVDTTTYDMPPRVTRERPSLH